MAKSIPAIITDILKEIGFPPGLLGYEYVRYGITQAVEDTAVFRRMAAAFYPAVAKQFNTTPSRVDRAIRYAIEVSFDRCPPDVLEKYFGNTISYDTGKLTNREFISAMAYHVRACAGR